MRPWQIVRFCHCLFNIVFTDAARNLSFYSVEWQDVDDELERMWKEVVVV